MIHYDIDKQQFTPIIGTSLLQFFTTGGLIQFGEKFQIDSTRKLILVFQKKTDMYIRVLIKFDGPLFFIKSDKKVHLNVQTGAYPVIDNNLFNCAVSNPIESLVSNIEFFYSSMNNEDNSILKYFKGIVIHFFSQKKIIIQSTDYPESFSISNGDENYQNLIEYCERRVMLIAE